MASAAEIPGRPISRRSSSLLAGAVPVLRPLHALVAFPAWLFLATLSVMLFRPPDLKLYDVDRIAFVLLMLVVFLRALILRQPLRAGRTVLLPLSILLFLAAGGALVHPYRPEVWSVLAAKWIVPCGLFYAARMIFQYQHELRLLENFLLIVLAYLTIMAILFLSGSKSLIIPPFIVDENLGIHADRARGPFLQAVANGVTINLLGLMALDSYRRGKLRGIAAVALLIGVPLAILATKTRAVWASFGASVVALLVFSSDQRTRRTCLAILLAASLGLVCAVTFGDGGQSMRERLEERSPVQFRVAVYQAGWDMFLAKPLLGWGAAQMQPELARQISDFHQDEFYFHNTFLEIAVEYGLLGLALYLWVLRDLLRVGRRQSKAGEGGFLDSQFRRLWPVFLGVYLLNACFVVMNYQFVNGVVFSLAGILTAQNEGVGACDGN